MNAKITLRQRIISIIICLALILSYVPFMTSAAVDDIVNYDRVVDDNTMDNWTKYFDINNLDTVNAGGVWTDKSVFTNTDEFPNSVKMLDSDRNFLTAMSSIAANKEIVGYSTIPTDTVLVLDLSASMLNSDSEGDLIDAANDAITELLKVNTNNRVGVVLYSASNSIGASTYSESVTRILPIDRYTAGRSGEYLSLNNNGRVSVATGVTGTIANADLDNRKTFSGGTYIQAGLWEAMNMFKEMDTIIGENNWQSGDNRMPIMVLMSDGAPSTGTSNFADVGNSNVGNGNESNLTAGNAFLTQLTASYVMNQVEAHYQKNDSSVRGLFYTLGFNIGNNNVARSVMNPDSSTYTDSLWSTYNALVNGRMSVQVKDTDGDYDNVYISKNSFATSKSYVDRYFSASGDGLANAFESIVEEIIIQSRYYPTHLAGSNPDFSGYVEFTDTLGEYMEVKHINGILLGDKLFDGHAMASKINDGGTDGLGTPESPTALGDEFIRAVKTRLGIAETADAQQLVAKAYADKQLYYNNENNWSNYIAWYAKVDGTYAGFYDEDGTEPVPQGAVYINRSYGFLGETTGSIKNSDMMYMSVQVRTNIITGEQTVLWKIPASLVPMVTYKVSLKGTNVDNATDVKLTVEDENVAPIRLVYETGLRSDLNAFNITRITGTAVNGEVKTDESHIAADGYTRLFWNNHFDISASEHEYHKTAMAEFTPNKENERFYYTFDSAVLKKVGDKYELVGQNETLNPNGEYYHRRYTFNEKSDKPIFTYEKMSRASITAAVWDADFETLDNKKGAWKVAKGTPARELTMYDEEKAQNKTGSAHMIFYPYLTEQNNIHYVDMNLGNNGRLALTPEQGIKLSKTIDVYESGKSTDFTFRVTVHNANGTPYTGTANAYVTNLDETPSETDTVVSFSPRGIKDFELSADQTLWITKLPTGATYTIEEISDNSDYKLKSVHVNGVSTGKVASGTVAAYYIDDVDFVNTAIGEGHLVISKKVIDASGNTVDIADSVVFTAEVTLTDGNNNPVSGDFEGFTVPANGKFNVYLKEGETFTVRGIPEETRYSVREINIPKGFELNEQESSLTGVIDNSANDVALIVNDYVPTTADGDSIDVKITKQISGNRTQWLSGESYTFHLQRRDGSYVTIDTATISAQDTAKEHIFSLENETYPTAGVYHYRVVEEVGNRGGITYDTAERRFSVEVADSDNNGTLEIVNVKNEMNTAVSGNWQVIADFNNVYAPTGSAAATINIEKRISGNYSLSGYSFALYNANPVTNTDADQLLISSPTDASGKTSVSLTYSADDAGKTFTYYLAEIGHGEIINNVRYDNKVYEVEVTVNDNLDGTLSTQTVVKGLPTGTTVPTFENEYIPSSSDYLTISGKKVIDGDRVLNANEFEFKLTAITDGAPMPTANTVKNRADGSFQFGEIEFGDAHKGNSYEYTVTEVWDQKIGGFTYDETVYTVTVSVRDNGDQTITASAIISNGNSDVSDIIFTNEYDATDAEVTITGEKMLTGKTMQAGEFSFRLTAVTDGAPMPVNATVTNAANGEIGFGKITYTKAGVYEYTLSEVNGGDTRYDYDTSVYTVIVTVTDNSVGTLSARVTLKKNGASSSQIVFVNGFVPTPITYDIHTDFGGEKELSGRPLQTGEFEFSLINAVNGAQIGNNVKNDADGKFRFPQITIENVGIYLYKIVEVTGTAKGVSYDNSSYHIRLEVTQNADGSLKIASKQLYKGVVTKQDVGGVLTEVTSYQNITDSGRIVFNNTYSADPVYVTMQATKLLRGRELKDGEFKFDLYKTDDTFTIQGIAPVQDDVVFKLNDDGNGDVVFMPEKFEAPGSYYYVIVEDEENEKGVTVDSRVYKIEVIVTDNHQGEFEAALKVNGEPLNGALAETVVFENIYKAEAVQIVVSGKKVLDGRNLEAEEFSFELYDSDNNKIETVTNKADGTFTFTAIEVSEAGEYVYTVVETKGDAENVTYDETVYTVKAVVTDKLDGTFAVDYIYLSGNETVQNLIFNNVYAEPVPQKPIVSPSTGDSNNLWMWVALAFVSGTVLIGGTVALKKKETEQE